MIPPPNHDDDEDFTESPDITRGALSRFARVDERTKAIQEDLRNFRADVKLAIDGLIERIKDTERHYTDKSIEITKNHAELVEHLEKNFVKKESFSPVQHLVYGFVGLVVTAVLAAIFSLVLIK